MGFGNVGKVWSSASFPTYLQGITNSFKFRAVTIHHCGAPSLAQRPQGLKAQHIENIASFYRNEKGWSSAPHLFTDEDQVFGMCPLTERGIHAVSFNGHSIGIEMLGDFDSEDPTTGRGLQVVRTTAKATADLLKWMGLEASNATILFHREDPKTTKTCPGRKVGKDWFVGLVKAEMGGAPTSPAAVSPWTITINGKAFVGTFREIKNTIFVAADAAIRCADKESLLPIKRSGDEFIVMGGEELENAFYDPAEQRTYAPIREIAEACRLKVSVDGKAITLGAS